MIKKSKRNNLLLFLSLASLIPLSGSASAEPAKPKYGHQATPLSLSHEYFRGSTAPDFWALIPYYAAQFNEKACSVASVSMLVNAARANDLTADEKLATQEELLKKVGDDLWTKTTGPKGHGVSLEELGMLLSRSLSIYGLKATVSAVHVSDQSSKTKEELRRVLLENEKSANDFVVINFIQGIYTNDAMMGHIAPIAAYDKKKRRVLVLDPDREWYEPYWVSEDTLLTGMATQDKTSGKYRGYVWVQLSNGK